MSTVNYLLELYRAPYLVQDRIKNILNQHPELLVDLEVGRKVIPYRKPISDFQLRILEWVDPRGLFLKELLVLETHEVWTWDENFNLMWMAEAGRKRQIEIVAIAESMSPSLRYPYAPL